MQLKVPRQTAERLVY